MCDVAFVIGRHIYDPFIEGGGKITYLLARALSELGIRTYLIKINYSLPDERVYILKEHSELSKNEKLYEWELRVGFLTQDSVLHTTSGIVISNLLELVASPLSVVRLIKRVNAEKENICIFIGNSSKLGGLLTSQLLRLFTKRQSKVLAIYRREEILRSTSRLIRPDIVFTTSKELSIRTSKLLDGATERVVFSYPPILSKEISAEEIPARKLPWLLYMGRVATQRFPLHVLKQIVTNLKRAPEEVSLVIVAPPESVSMNWLKTAKEIVSKLNMEKRILFIFKTLNNEEKKFILSRASIFIFPGRGTVAIEPPLAVIESLVHGLYLVTTGDNSTRELVNLGVGQLVKNFAKLDIEECLDKSRRLSKKISILAQRTFTFQKLVDTLRAALIS